ncbi:MAG: helix-turn-helix transcriptional regulator [Rhizobiales bacterium]|nr:helix-turn-helix transcriptional regulator [Hyphomicrobiales bacterium]
MPGAISSRGRGWVGLEAEFGLIRAGLTKVPASLDHRLGIHVGPSVNAACRCDGRVHRRVQSHGDIDVVPAGLAGEWEDDADCSILRFWISPALIRQAAREVGCDPDRVALAPQFQLRDQRIEHIAWALKAELETEISSDRLYAESLGMALAVRLVHGAVAARDDGLPARQTLSPRQQRRLVDFIETHLDRELSLGGLAAVADISISHLKALFRQTMGMPVHQYVIRRRVERAKALLLAGTMPISQVALAAGFAHQSHMAHCMKRVLGVTPRQVVGIGR